MPRRLQIALAACLAAAACDRPSPGEGSVTLTADQQATASAVIVAPSGRRTPGDDFVARASAADAFELQAARTALQRAADPDVRTFAEMMIRDHSQLASELRRAVAASGRSFSDEAVFAPEQQLALTGLAHSDAASFDKTYMAGQVKAHQAALALAQAYARHGELPALKAFAGQAASLAQQHYAIASALHAALK